MVIGDRVMLEGVIEEIRNKGFEITYIVKINGSPYKFDCAKIEVKEEGLIDYPSINR